MVVKKLKLSTKGRYGLRIMIDLAIHSVNDHISLNSVAERQNISENYLEQIISPMRKAGLVKSIKGSQGGYLLGNKPSKITVGEVLRVLEGDFASVDEGADSDLDKSSIQGCIQAMVWDKLANTVYEFIDSITLEDVVEEYESRNGAEKLMYFI